MKKFYQLLLCMMVVAAVYSQDGHPVTPAGSKTSPGNLTAADWQADLRFLQQTVHKDYSFLFKKVTTTAFDAEVEKL